MYKEKEISTSPPYPIQAPLENFIFNITMMLAMGMIVSSFTAYVTAKYFPFSIPVMCVSFVLLLGVSFIANDGPFKFNLNQPKKGILIFSPLFGVFLGAVVGRNISLFSMIWWGGALLFLLIGFYGRWIRKTIDRTSLGIKYALILVIAVTVKCSFLQIIVGMVGMGLLNFIWRFCLEDLEEVYLYYKDRKSKTELYFIGAFKLYTAFFRIILALGEFLLGGLPDFSYLITVPREEKQ